MRGAIVGDIVGSIYEGRHMKSKAFPFWGDRVRFTDDTVCTVAVAATLLDGADPTETLQAWTRRYPHRGYGGRFKGWIASDRPQPYYSFGNGSAMRVSPCAWLGATQHEARDHALRVTVVTHDHPEGIKGALATTDAITLARAGIGSGEIRRHIAQYGYDISQSVDEIRPTYRFDVTCQGSVPQAITCALEARDFEDAIRNAVSIGGDTDTIAAIAGSIAEARFGVPDAIWQRAADYLTRDILAVIDRFDEAMRGPREARHVH